MRQVFLRLAIAALAGLFAANRKAQKFAGLNMTVGKMGYNIKTGALTFNGQSLTNPDQDALAAACRSILKGRK